jgi:Zn-dependent metalloprotease
MKKNFGLSTCCLAAAAAAMLVSIPAGAQQGTGSSPFLRNRIHLDRSGFSKLAVRFAEGTQVSAQTFVDLYKDELGLASDDELKPFRVVTDRLGQTHYRFQQHHKGRRLAAVELFVHEKNGAVFLVHGELVPGLDLEVIPLLSEPEALSRAMTHLAAEDYMWEDAANEAFLKREQNDPRATFYPKGELCLTRGLQEMKPENFRLAYRFDIYAEKPLNRYAIDIDARTGEVLEVRTRLLPADVPGRGQSVYDGTVSITIDQADSSSYRLRQAQRGNGIETYDMRHGTDYDAALDFVDADTNFTDANAAAGVSAHWAAEATYDYYLTQHGRRSYDDNDGKLLSYVHFGNDFFNAFWDGARMTFGDGNNNRTPLTTADVFGHELTHGVTEFSAGLEYANESGALNESFSDIFGEAIEAFIKGQNDWLIGAQFGAIRSMADPGLFGNPDTYFGRFWVPTVSEPQASNDWGGVHSNSGVQNQWFYLLTAGGEGTNDRNETYAVTGIGLEQASQIAYRNLTTYLGPSSGYFDVRLASIFSALDLFGADSPQYRAALDAWFAVGVRYPTLEASAVPSPESLRLLAEAAATADTMELTISNFGLDDLSVSAIQISGAPFQIVSMPVLPLVVNFQSSFKLEIVFRPETAGESDGSLTVTSNDAAHPVLTVALLGKGFAIRPAQTGTIYAVTGRVAGVNSTLLTVDPTSGSGSSVGLSGAIELHGVSVRPSTGELYATIGGGSETTLLRVDAQTGEAYAVGNVAIPNLRAIAFDQNDDLYGARFTNGDLFRFDLATGDTVFIGATKINLLAGLALNPGEGSLWGVSVTGTSYKIDKSTATATVVGNAGVGQIADIEFDAEGKLFGLSGFSPAAVSKLLRMDPATGKGAVVGATGFKLVTGLAMQGAVPTGVVARTAALPPAAFDLQQNQPNPFNPSTRITYSLARPSLVKLAVYNSAGKLVRILVPELEQAAGVYEVHWDGRNVAGEPVASGVYLYRLEAGDFVRTRKMLVVK